MSQNSLAREISHLSLGQAAVSNNSSSDTQVSADLQSKKHRRPARAFYNFAPDGAVQPPMAPFQQGQGGQLPASPMQPGYHEQRVFTPQKLTPKNVSLSGQIPPAFGMNANQTISGNASGGGGAPAGMGTINAPFSPGLMSPASPSAAFPSQQPLDSYFPEVVSHFVPVQRWRDQRTYLQSTFETKKNSVPPLPTTEFYCVDQGSCNPELMNLTMYNIPNEEHLRSATKLPLGLTVQPFAPTTSIDGGSDDGVPTVADTQLTGDEVKAPMRCRRCRGYVNPYFEFTYDSSVVCNMCKVKTKLSDDELAPIGPNGQRSDIYTRPELLKGAVDFLVPKIYNANRDVDTVALHYVFLIDVSLMANENGSSLAIAEAVRSSIEYIAKEQPKCKVAIITYDNKLKFYNLNPKAEFAQEYIVSELDEVFLPLYSGLFALPSESMNIIDDTLKKIVKYITSDKYSHVPQSCYGSALQAAKLALDQFTNKQGGKIICSLNSLPTVGNGNFALRKEDDSRHDLRCNNDFYSKLANELLSSCISVDLFVTSGSFIDLATTGFPVEMTSGNVKYYPNFRPDGNDSFTVINDMVDTVASIVGYQGILKVRCSNGLTVGSYYVKATNYSDRDPVIPVITTNTTVDVLFRYVEKLKAGTDVFFQAALLYTDIHGTRKVRSINCSAAVSNNIHEIFKFVNQNSVLRIVIQDIIRTLGDCNFPNIRKSIDDKLADILTQYRALVNSKSSTQLILPDSLKLLPMFLLSFEKSDLMKPNTKSTRGNDRVYDLFKLEFFDSRKLSYKLYPQIIPLHVLLEEDDLTFYDANDKMLQVAEETVDNLAIRNAYMQLTNGGCYLIFNGETVYLWFNENTNRMLLRDLLGVDESFPVNEINLMGGELPEMDTEINLKARNVIKFWGQRCCRRNLPIVLLRPNIDHYYSRVMGDIMVEDKTINMVDSFDNYLVQVHRHIQEKLKKENFVKIASGSARQGSESFAQKFIQF